MAERDPFPADLKTLRLVEGERITAKKVTDGERVWYIKNLPPREAEMTMRASNAELGPDAITRIAKAKPIAWEDLSEELKQKAHGAWGCQMFLIEGVPNQHGMYQLSNDAPEDERREALEKGLGGKPITRAEQAKILAEWKELNRQGVHHRDLGSNTGFKRHASGKLEMGVYDFDDDQDNERNDISDLRFFMKEMQKAGTAEQNTQSRWASDALKMPDADADKERRDKRGWSRDAGESGG